MPPVTAGVHARQRVTDASLQARGTIRLLGAAASVRTAGAHQRPPTLNPPRDFAAPIEHIHRHSPPCADVDWPDWPVRSVWLRRGGTL